MKISSYHHATPGRLRIKISQVKGSQEIAQKVERILKNLQGVQGITANPLTGNVLVLFDPESLTHSEIVEVLITQGYLERQQKVSRQSARSSPLTNVFHPEYVGKAVADVILQTAVEFAVKRALLALV
jgi:copper chaperone CopZ